MNDNHQTAAAELEMVEGKDKLGQDANDEVEQARAHHDADSSDIEWDE